MSRIVHEINRFTSLVIRSSLRILALFLFLFLLYEGITRGYRFGYRIFCPDPNPVRAEETVTVAEDTDAAKLAGELEEKGIIWNQFAFLFTKKFYQESLVPGSYKVDSSMTIPEILDVLSGKSASAAEGGS